MGTASTISHPAKPTQPSSLLGFENLDADGRTCGERLLSRWLSATTCMLEYACCWLCGKEWEMSACLRCCGLWDSLLAMGIICISSAFLTLYPLTVLNLILHSHTQSHMDWSMWLRIAVHSGCRWQPVALWCILKMTTTLTWQWYFLWHTFVCCHVWCATVRCQNYTSLPCFWARCLSKRQQDMGSSDLVVWFSLVMCPIFCCVLFLHCLFCDY